jgi:hypothetical protein
MRKLSLKTLIAMAVAGASAVLPAFADDASSVGTARVPRQSEPARLATQDAAPVAPAKKDGVSPARFTWRPPVYVGDPAGPGPYGPYAGPGAEHIVGSGFAHGGYADNGYAGGDCANGNCHSGHGGHGHRTHGPRFHTPLEAWVYGDDNAATYPPDYGWSRPVKRPVLNRIPVQYYQMDPQAWAGDPRFFAGAPVYPQVYMPTDTTQLGYYYQRTPQWQPNPNMIPAPPWPATWHRRECPEYTAQQRARMMSAAGQGYGYGYDAVDADGYPAHSAPKADKAAAPKDLPPGEKIKAPPKDLPPKE